MDASHGDDRPAVAEPDTEASLRTRTATADAAFVAEGIALGLPLNWIERAPLSEDWPPLALAWRAPDDHTRLSADHWQRAADRDGVAGGPRTLVLRVLTMIPIARPRGSAAS